MPTTAPTLQTIADRAGVSRNTVSCALRADPRISEKTRERIRRIADELGYRPNPMVSALMQSLRQAHPVAHTANLAFIHSCLTPEEWRRRPYYRQLFEGAESRAHEMGYNLTPIWAREPGITPERFSKILRSRNVLGLVIGPLGAAGMLPIEWNHFPMAAMGTSLPEPRLHRAATYFNHAIPYAWTQLRQLGYRNIGVLFSEEANRRVDYALEAGCAVLVHSMGVHDLPVMRRCDQTAASLGAWVRKHNLDALILGCDMRAVAMIRELGWRIPEDIGLASLTRWPDDVPGATFRRNFHVIGSTATDLVVDQLLRNERGIPRVPKTVMIECSWDPGSLSTKQPSSNAQQVSRTGVA